jgi:hypothetical protein
MWTAIEKKQQNCTDYNLLELFYIVARNRTNVFIFLPISLKRKLLLNSNWGEFKFQHDGFCMEWFSTLLGDSPVALTRSEVNYGHG